MKCFKFGCYETNGIASEKRKDISQEGIEGMNARVIKRVYNGQVAEFGKSFGDHLTERSRMEIEKQWEAVKHIHDGVKSITQRSGRKGTPCKRHHDSFMVETKRNGKWVVPNGLSKRRENDNWLNKCNESTKETMRLDPRPGCHIKPGDDQIKHGKLQTETNSAETSDGESIQHLTLTQLSPDGNEKMGKVGCDKTNKIAQNEGMVFTDSLRDDKVVTSSAYSREASPSFAVNSTTSNEQNMADLFGKGMPLCSPGQHNWSLRDDTLYLHKDPHLVGNVMSGIFPEIAQGKGSGGGARGGGCRVPYVFWKK